MKKRKNRSEKERWLDLLALAALLESEQAVSYLKFCRLNNWERSEKSFQRMAALAREVGLPIRYETGNGAFIRESLEVENWLSAVSRLIQGILGLSSMRKFTYGGFSSRAVVHHLSFADKPAETSLLMLTAILQSELMLFLYFPQHEITLKKIRAEKRRIGQPKDSKNVTLLPHGLVFTEDLFLVVGETAEENGTVFRQYEVKGIRNLKRGESSPRTMKFKPDELYGSSLKIWLGGQKYKLTLKEDNFGLGERIYQQEVNGEEEILRQVASSLGRLKIIDPPAELKAKAAELGLHRSLLFAKSKDRRRSASRKKSQK